MPIELFVLGALLPFAALCFTALMKHCYRWSFVVLGVGILSSVFGWYMGQTPTRVLEGLLTESFLATLILWSLVLLYVLIKASLSRGKPNQLSLPQSRTQVVVPYHCYHKAGHCWHCGKPDTPLQPYRLIDGMVTPVAVASEHIVVAIPLCREHGSNLYYSCFWIGMLMWPFSCMGFFIPIMFLGDGFEKFAKGWHLIPLTEGMMGGVGLLLFCTKYMSVVKRFGLVKFNPDHAGCTISFADAELAALVEKEIAEQQALAEDA